jgi:hypothetical protein
MPSFSQRRAACSGAAPPKAIMILSEMFLPFSTAWTRAALAMFSSTTSADAEGGRHRVERQPVADIAQDRLVGGAGVELDRAAGEIVGIELAEHEIGIGDRRPLAAAAIAGRAGLGPGAFRAGLDAAHRVDPGDRAAAGADLDHLDDRDGDRHARTLGEAIGAGDLEGARRARRKVLDQADLGRRAAHVVGDDLVQPKRRRCRPRRSRRRPGRTRRVGPEIPRRSRRRSVRRRNGS